MVILVHEGTGGAAVHWSFVKAYYPAYYEPCLATVVTYIVLPSSLIDTIVRRLICLLSYVVGGYPNQTAD